MANLISVERASLALGIYGLFCYHALYFAALSLAPAAEASLITSLWALFTVVFSGLLPGQPLRLAHLLAALIGLAAATLLVWNSLGVAASGSHRALGFTLAFGCALIWSITIRVPVVTTVMRERLSRGSVSATVRLSML